MPSDSHTLHTENDGLDELPTQNSVIEESDIPISEMSFGSIDEARKYYENYDRKNGFYIRTRTSYKGHRKTKATSVTLVCAREGIYDGSIKNREYDNKVEDRESKTKKKRRTCSTAICDCKAHLRINYDKWTCKWKVKDFYYKHNHDFVTPSKNLAEVFQRENLEVGKVASIFCGEHMGYDDRDVWNHLRNVRHRNLDYGDASWMANYFKNRQVQNPHFYYAIQYNENGRAANFFWVDSRSRMAYNYFRDVISFDTTYWTNKYDMPFAPFTGVNHQMHSIQFGCALLQDEAEVTFIWLFQTWIDAMGGRPPTSFLTDQDLAMKSAVAKVFPNTCHRLSIWHILKNFGEKLSHAYFTKSKFKADLDNLLWSTYKKEDFDEGWMSLVKEYESKGKWIEEKFDTHES